MSSKPNLVIDSFGNKRWYVMGLLHREDGPAIEYASGDKLWYLNNKLHREGGPAAEYINGCRWWYRHGIQIEDPNKCKQDCCKK